METKSGFTLIQLFVVIILCVLWLFVSILIPQFSSASTSSDLGGLTGEDLLAMRSQIELYKIHHNGELPGTAAGVSFVQALTQKTNPDGSLNPTSRYGPYLKKIPVNHYNGLDTVEIDGVVGGGDYGWHYNTTTGEFHADTDKHAGL